jgi:hypothetical protein
MKANRRFDLKVTRTGSSPVLLADPNRIDHVEVLDLHTNEVELFWDLPAGDASRLARRLRHELVALDADEFIERWRAAPQEPE